MSHEVSAPTNPVPFDLHERQAGVLVGFDGSANAVQALEFGARLALRRHTKLTVAMAYKVPAMFYASYAAIPSEPEYAARRRDAEETLGRARELLKDYPGEVDFSAVEGDSVGALVDLTATAQTVVVGARGRGGFFGRILGSVASALPSHSKCPTIVIPSDEQENETANADGGSAARADEPVNALTFEFVHDESPVIVGVDGSQHSRTAALQAAEMAVEAKTSLSLVMALHPLDESLFWYPEINVDVAELTNRRRRELTDQIAVEVDWVSGHFPELEIDGSVQLGEPDLVMEAATQRAQLTVVGCRGRGALRSALLGSTSRALLHRAVGPVMVVPNLADDRLKDQPSKGDHDLSTT